VGDDDDAVSGTMYIMVTRMKFLQDDEVDK